MKKNTTKVIKEANQYLVMQCIQAFEPVTLEEIAEKTLLSRPTILEIINSFKEEGIVVNGGFRESTGGRPPQLLCINGDSAYAIGNIYPLIHAIYYVDTVEIEKQYKQECV